ncbi:fungal-specific transcription factor domain-containing protein [Sordaria brevicollis]|uniref:Fungal-specific transcription factor domain-containing protein n=1 Tax=Sordaria brevicollis TaxID=83679 RepID=A0AAE0PMJ3_SORBR|nr:fungal-specific transcription factor domain-containing protein [Sordaria brevicollis]
MRQYQRLWDPADHNPANCSGLCRKKNSHKAFPALVNAVFAMASLFGPHSPEQNSARATAYFNQTQKLDLLDIIDDEVGIELVQLLLLMGFYLQSTEKFSKCWNITGLAIRMAQNMGLQLSVQEAKTRGLLTSQPTQLECEMRLRVWYGCVLLDREISMSFGRPLMITNSSSDRLGLPHAIDDEYLSDKPGAEWGSQPPGQHSMLESYIQTIKLYDILGQVLDREEWRDGPAFSKVTPADLGSAPENVAANTQSMLDLDTLIMEWLDSLPEYLRYDPSPENDRRRDGAGDLTPANEIPPTDFSAQAKRLHARFHHVRVLILRPALEQLFGKQRRCQQSLHLPKPSRIKVAVVQDLMQSEIAAQCVVSADSLVRSLDSHIHSHSLTAWWYNIGYLHTAGSTLLMGQLCSFGGSTVRAESLAASWRLCLDCILRYTGVSSIANKSYHLLKDSAKRLLSDDNLSRQYGSLPGSANPQQNQVPDPASQNIGQPTPSVRDAVSLGMDYSAAGTDNQTLMGVLDTPATSSVAWEATGADIGNNLPQNLSSEAWTASDPTGSAYWPFVPFFSQLESLPSDFDLSALDT